ncbi:MAG: DEAD/DEAH box helicase family protein [Shewanella xiamenensis]|nr:DEAD/DEAH box helicase family protein [Shewanella xiamenensis]
MAFKTNIFASKASADPAAHFKTLTKRQYPDVMPHQKDILEAYAASFENKPDVALQLPTGSGKTLVGLLIADWRRIKNGDRVVYLCPTVQLVRQTVLQATTQYGIDVVDLSGKRRDFSPTDQASYKTGSKVAVTTYSAFFNTNPYFEDPNLVIIDDAHAAENYIAKMWTLEISSEYSLFDVLVEFLRSHITAQDYARLKGDWNDPAETSWVEKIPTPLLDKISNELVAIIDSHAKHDQPQIHYPWSLLRDHFESCHVYLSKRQILIRPLIPPTFTHYPFANANQRIFMSATLGAGGDLERLTGRKRIERLAAPTGFQMAGVGRRFFIFPSLSLTEDETDALRLKMQSESGRSVILTPNNLLATAHIETIKQEMKSFQTFTKDQIEDDKAPFVHAPKGVAILANRYDGVDFPGDECRLLCIDGLPKAINAQERFLMSRMGAGALYNERVQTRVLQAMGRCTRSLQDRSAVFVTGNELVDFLIDNRKWPFFPSELQAELNFGVEQSKDVSEKDFLDNFKMFLSNNNDWSSADNMIRGAISQFQQIQYPEMADLETVVKEEIAYQEAIWNKDYLSALKAIRTLLSNLNHPNLRGYRALWYYLGGITSKRLSESPQDQYAVSAKDYFSRAKNSAPSLTWLNSVLRELGNDELKQDTELQLELKHQVEAISRVFTNCGIATNHKFEQRVSRIVEGLKDFSKFEQSQVELGVLLGFTAGNDESDAAPDPWWLGYRVGVVFEAHAEADPGTVFGANKARQASSHPKWIKSRVQGTGNMNITPVLVTPCTQARYGADPHLEDVCYWNLNDYVEWAHHAISVLRELKGSYSGESDLVWQAEAMSRIERERINIHWIIGLQKASNSMEIVD